MFGSFICTVYCTYVVNEYVAFKHHIEYRIKFNNMTYIQCICISLSNFKKIKIMLIFNQYFGSKSWKPRLQNRRLFSSTSLAHFVRHIIYIHTQVTDLFSALLQLQESNYQLVKIWHRPCKGKILEMGVCSTSFF